MCSSVFVCVLPCVDWEGLWWEELGVSAVMRVERWGFACVFGETGVFVWRQKWLCFYVLRHEGAEGKKECLCLWTVNYLWVQGLSLGETECGG